MCTSLTSGGAASPPVDARRAPSRHACCRPAATACAGLWRPLPVPSTPFAQWTHRSERLSGVRTSYLTFSVQDPGLVKLLPGRRPLVLSGSLSLSPGKTFRTSMCWLMQVCLTPVS